ncbi:hypothetical protein ACAX43_24665 [Paraburkholderia sp. IW21]|uniref:hypothetical protein n=1 Tax=Paraburkholderia sp. IW21 TaxID=3242488 RepID=UPI00352302C2
MSTFAQEDKDDGRPSGREPPDTLMRATNAHKRQAFELNVNQIEYFARNWIISPDMEPPCTFIVRPCPVRGANEVRHQIHGERDNAHSGAALHLIDALRHKFGPLLAFVAPFFGISGTSQWKV